MLGQGAFGVVYKCKRRDTREEFAVKMIDQVETTLPSIEKEIQALRALEGEYVIKMHDVFYEKVFVCIVLELYRGGDMIQGMMAHWKKIGMIPMSAVAHLTKQMWCAVAFLHDKSYAHRDVKGDNFIMDFPDVENPKQKIYLSDFGTVVHVKPGERLSQKCGTNNYWSPEFYKLNYGLKVDCWAVGVVMFGFFSGKFPFKTEEEVKKKNLVIHPRAGPEGEKLIRWAFERDEKNRCEAKQALEHEFLSGAYDSRSLELTDEDKNFKAEIQETGANAGVKERRRELVQRLVQLANENNTSTEDRSAALVEVLSHNADMFSVVDKAADASYTYEWCKREEVDDMLSVAQNGHLLSVNDVNAEADNESITRLLKEHNIDATAFGVGKAKPLDEFVDEIKAGKSRLLLDATKHKHLVRVVDAVLLRVAIDLPDGRRYLIETQEVYPDGRESKVCRLPGNKKEPHENMKQTAERFLLDMLGMADAGVVFDYEQVETEENGIESPSYPGVQTVYLKEIVTGRVTTDDPSILERLGQGRSSFTNQDKEGYKREFSWYDEPTMKAKGIGMGSKSGREDISALVYPPIGLEENELEQFLVNNNVDISQWTTCRDLSEELVKGASTLKAVGGKVVRIVDIAVLAIEKDGKVLVQVEEKRGDKTTQVRRLPAAKRRADEHVFSAVRTYLSSHMGVNVNLATIDHENVRMIQEQQGSTTYPGISAVYKKHFLSVKM